MYKVNCLPKAFLVGFAKCGTTELHSRLIDHHQVHGALRKEVSASLYKKNYSKTYIQYGKGLLDICSISDHINPYSFVPSEVTTH